MKQPHKHAELIKAWADGAEIEYQNHLSGWEHVEIPAWDEDTEYRIKPEKEYPKSTLSYDELCKLVNVAHKMQQEDGDKQGYQTYLARVVADAAVKKYIQENKE